MKEQLSNFLIKEYDRILFESYELSEQKELEIIQELLCEGVLFESEDSLDDKIASLISKKQKNPGRNPAIAKKNKSIDNALYVLRKKKKALSHKDEEPKGTTGPNKDEEPKGTTGPNKDEEPKGTTGPNKDEEPKGTTGPNKDEEPSDRETKKIESLKEVVKTLEDKYKKLQKSNSYSIKAQIDFLNAMTEDENPYLKAYITSKKLKYKVKFLQELSKAHISNESLREITSRLEEAKKKLGESEKNEAEVDKRGKTETNSNDISVINNEAGNASNGSSIKKPEETGKQENKLEESPGDKSKREEAEKLDKEAKDKADEIEAAKKIKPTDQRDIYAEKEDDKDTDEIKSLRNEHAVLRVKKDNLAKKLKELTNTMSDSKAMGKLSEKEIAQLHDTFKTVQAGRNELASKMAALRNKIESAKNEGVTMDEIHTLLLELEMETLTTDFIINDIGKQLDDLMIYG
jgi:hypothetical protein